MSEDIVAEALKLFEDETRKNSGLQKFYEDFYSAIKNDYKNFEGCIEENRKKKNKHDSNVFCHINHKNEIALEKFQEQFKSIRLHDTKHCDYLLYWMSDKIAECKYNTHRIIWLYNIFQKFWENGICCNKKDSENNACEKPYVIEFDLNALKSKKGLYVLLDYYNSNKNILKNETSEKKKSFCNYVKYMFKLYNNMDSDVDINVHKKYDNELSIFRSNFENEENLSELKIGCNYPNLSAQSERELNNSIMSSEGNFQRFIPFKVELSKYVIEPPSEMDDILKETSSYKLYKEFETKVEAETDNEYCKGIFKEENNHQAEGIEICKKIINNFNKLYKNEIKTSVGNPCLHYKNWVYHEIWKFVINQSEYKNAKEIIYKFLDIQKGKNLRSSNPKNVCHYYFIFSDFIELNSKKEEKDLHDYFKYYHTIYENISAHISDKEKYKKYIQYIYELYKRHKIDWKCCDASYGVDPLCRHYFKCEEEYNPSDLLEILNGAKKEDIKKKYKTPPVVLFGEEKLTGDLKEEDVMRIQYGRCTKIYYPEDREKVFALRCDYKASNDHFGKFSNNLPDGKKKDNAKATTSTSITPVDMSDSSGMSNMEEEESNPVSYKIPTSVALGLGTAFIFFLYYKFTPFGSLFGKRNRGRTSFEDDFNEEYMQELYHGSEFEDVSPSKRRIQIAYQRA